MIRRTKAFLIGTPLSVFLVVGFLLAGQLRREQVDRGDQWLSWSKAERIAFIDGFLTGYSNGSHKACLSANEIFEVGEAHRLGNDPAARCEARIETYTRYESSESGPDLSGYADVITEFYTKHPERRGIPFFYLLQFLSDKQHKTADELSQMASKGELRTNF